MTTSNPDFKRYNITIDKHDHPVPYETEHGQWVKYSSYKALQAECEKLRTALAESRANDLTAMGYLNKVSALVGGDDFPDMIEKVEELKSELDAHKAARIAYASEFPLGADGTPDVGSIHENIRLLKKDAEFGRSVLTKREPGKKYGCHCDLDDGMEPDVCVIDTNERHNCVYATRIDVKEQCKYWTIITTDQS